MMAWLRGIWREDKLSILVIAGLAAAFILLRSSPSDLASVEAFDTQVAGSQATIAYFYSNT